MLALQSERVDFDSYLESSKARSVHGGVILWPEYSAPFEIKPSPENGNPPRDRANLADLVRDKRSVLVFGTRKNLPDGEHYTAIPRAFLKEGGKRAGVDLALPQNLCGD